MKTVRELSVGRPCVTLGFVLRETVSRISYRDHHGTSKFISKRWAVHTEPCPSCPDYVRRRNARMIIAIDLLAGALGPQGHTNRP